MLQNLVSDLDIVNLSLDMLGAFNISSFDDTTNQNCLLANRHFPLVKAQLLESFEWSFSRRQVVPVELVAEDHPELMIAGYHCYKLPNDFLRLSMYLFGQNYPYKTNQYQVYQNWIMNGGYIYTLSPLHNLFYHTNVINASEYPTQYINLLKSRMALSMAQKILGFDADLGQLAAFDRTYEREARKLETLQMEASPTGYSDLQIARV